MNCLRTPIELQQLTESSQLKHPRFLILHAAVLLRDRNPDFNIEVLVDDLLELKTLILIARNKFTRPFVSFYLTDSGSLKSLELLLERTHEDFRSLGEFIVFHTEAAISEHLKNTILAKTFEFLPSLCRMNAYYMPTDFHKAITALNPALPEGFSFVDLDPDLDAPFLSETWPVVQENSIFNTKSKLAHLPSVGVIFNDRQQLASFEMLHQLGVLNHLYTVPAFRGKGLATAVELKLCQKLLQINICPFKCIVAGNGGAAAMADKSPYWRKVYNGDDDDDKPLVLDYRMTRLLLKGFSRETFG